MSSLKSKVDALNRDIVECGLFEEGEIEIIGQEVRLLANWKIELQENAIQKFYDNRNALAKKGFVYNETAGAGPSDQIWFDLPGFSTLRVELVLNISGTHWIVLTGFFTEDSLPKVKTLIEFAESAQTKTLSALKQAS